MFYAYENLIVAVAEAHQLKWVKNHYQKADLAHELFERKLVSNDMHDELLRLNHLRKDVSYGEPGAELSGENLEELVTDLERFLDEVDGQVSELEEAEEDE